jgi:hypothetical protein
MPGDTVVVTLLGARAAAPGAGVVDGVSVRAAVLVSVLDVAFVRAGGPLSDGSVQIVSSAAAAIATPVNPMTARPETRRFFAGARAG